MLGEAEGDREGLVGRRDGRLLGLIGASDGNWDGGTEGLVDGFIKVGDAVGIELGDIVGLDDWSIAELLVCAVTDDKFP